MVEEIRGDSEAANRTLSPVWVRVESSQGRLPRGEDATHAEQGWHTERPGKTVQLIEVIPCDQIT